MTNDMKQAIIPKSDQLNADDLLTGPITIKITGVTVRGGQEQPVSINYEGDNGKPYKPCKSMCRCMVAVWGPDSSAYVGKSMTLYCDPKVKWAGMEVGGLRISHMSDIGSAMTMALTTTKGSRKPFTVKPLAAIKESAPRSPTPPPSPDTPTEAAASGGADLLTFEQGLSLQELLDEKKIDKAKLLAAAEKKSGDVYLSLSQLPASFYSDAVAWIEKH